MPHCGNSDLYGYRDYLNRLIGYLSVFRRVRRRSIRTGKDSVVDVASSSSGQYIIQPSSIHHRLPSQLSTQRQQSHSEIHPLPKPNHASSITTSGIARAPFIAIRGESFPTHKLCVFLTLRHLVKRLIQSSRCTSSTLPRLQSRLCCEIDNRQSKDWADESRPTA